MQRNPSLERRLSIMDEGMDFDIPSYLTFDSCEAEAGFSFQMSPPRSARKIKKMGNTTGNEEISNVTMGSLQENAQKGSSKSSKTISGEQYRNSRDNMKKKQRNDVNLSGESETIRKTRTVSQLPNKAEKASSQKEPPRTKHGLVSQPKKLDFGSSTVDKHSTSKIVKHSTTSSQPLNTLKKILECSGKKDLESQQCRSPLFPKGKKSVESNSPNKGSKIAEPKVLRKKSDSNLSKVTTIGQSTKDLSPKTKINGSAQKRVLGGLQRKALVQDSKADLQSRREEVSVTSQEKGKDAKMMKKATVSRFGFRSQKDDKSVKDFSGRMPVVKNSSLRKACGSISGKSEVNGSVDKSAESKRRESGESLSSRFSELVSESGSSNLASPKTPPVQSSGKIEGKSETLKHPEYFPELEEAAVFQVILPRPERRNSKGKMKPILTSPLNNFSPKSPPSPLIQGQQSENSSKKTESGLSLSSRKSNVSLELVTSHHSPHPEVKNEKSPMGVLTERNMNVKEKINEATKVVEDLSAEKIQKAYLNVKVGDLENCVGFMEEEEVDPLFLQKLLEAESVGVEALERKGGRVRNSPPVGSEKDEEQPGCWSPIKTADLGPFDCTKKTRLTEIDSC